MERFFCSERFFSSWSWWSKISSLSQIFWWGRKSSPEALSGNLFFFLFSGGEFLLELHPLSPSPSDFF